MGIVRNLWRRLTSMSTALVLLFLLALAALVGAMLPQRSLNAQKVDQYIADRPTLGPLMGTLELFAVFASSWFTAIYALLFMAPAAQKSTCVPCAANRCGHRAICPGCRTMTSEHYTPRPSRPPSRCAPLCAGGVSWFGPKMLQRCRFRRRRAIFGRPET